MSESKDSYVPEVLVGQVNKSDTCGKCLRQKGGNDTPYSVIEHLILSSINQRTISAPNMWILRIGSFLQMLAHLAFNSIQDMHGNGFDTKIVLDNWNFRYLG